MPTIEEVAKTLDFDPVNLERESLKFFLQKELRNVEVEIYKIGNKHGVRSVLELDEKLKRGEIREEEMLDDFMELEFLETRKEKILTVLEKLPTFPKHFHNGSQERVKESQISDDPMKAIRQFMEFIQERIFKANQQTLDEEEI